MCADPSTGRGSTRISQRAADGRGYSARAAWPIVSIDCDGQFKAALERVRRHLRDTPPGRILVAAVNDPSALGAARAFQEAGRSEDCAIVCQNAQPDARAELRAAATPLVGSVGFFPERYGDAVIRLALDLLGRRTLHRHSSSSTSSSPATTSTTCIPTMRCSGLSALRGSDHVLTVTRRIRATRPRPPPDSSSRPMRAASPTAPRRAQSDRRRAAA